MKRIIKVFYILLLLTLPTKSSDEQISSSEKILKNDLDNQSYSKKRIILTPEEIAYCQEIKAQVLFTTGDPDAALKAYKTAYKSTDQYKLYRKNYAKNYRKLQKNKRFEEDYQEKSLSKKLKLDKKQKTIALQANNANQIHANVSRPLNDSLSMNSEMNDYNFDDFFDGNEFFTEGEMSINNDSFDNLLDKQVVQMNQKEKQKKYYIYDLSKESRNKIWHHPSVLALTPEMIEKKEE